MVNDADFELPLTPSASLEVLREIGLYMPAMLPKEARKYRIAASADVTPLFPPRAGSWSWLIDGWLPSGSVGVLEADSHTDGTRLCLQILMALGIGVGPFSSLALGSGPERVAYVDYRTDTLAPWTREHGLVEMYKNKLASCDQATVRSKHIRLSPDCSLYGHFDDMRPFSFLPALTYYGKQVLMECAADGSRLLVIDGLSESFGTDSKVQAFVILFLSELSIWARINDCAVVLLADKALHNEFEEGNHWYDASDFYWTFTHQQDSESSRKTAALTTAKLPDERMTRSIVELERLSSGFWEEIS